MWEIVIVFGKLFDIELLVNGEWVMLNSCNYNVLYSVQLFCIGVVLIYFDFGDIVYIWVIIGNYLEGIWLSFSGWFVYRI